MQNVSKAEDLLQPKLSRTHPCLSAACMQGEQCWLLRRGARLRSAGDIKAAVCFISPPNRSTPWESSDLCQQLRSLYTVFTDWVPRSWLQVRSWAGFGPGSCKFLSYKLLSITARSRKMPFEKREGGKVSKGGVGGFKGWGWFQRDAEGKGPSQFIMIPHCKVWR